MKRLLFLAIASSLHCSAIADDGAKRPEIGKWLFEEFSDPMTDFKRPIATLLSDDKGMLTIKCDSPGKNSVYAAISSAKYLGGGGLSAELREVTFRFDGGTPTTDLWKYNENYAFVSDNRFDHRFSKFLQALKPTKKLVVRLTTYRGETVDHIFNVDGSADTVAKVFDGCRDIPK